MELMVVLVASLEAILTNTVIAICGFLLARFEYVNKSTSDSLAKLNVQFLLPIMLFIKLANSLSINNFLNYWPIPVIFIIISTISLSLSNLLGKITNQSDYLKNFLKIAASFPNTNSIPTGIIHVLAISKSSELLKWGNGDNSSAMDARGISYIIVYTAFCNMARWSYGIKLFEEPKIGERAHLLGSNSEESNHQTTKLSK
ncbi:auxin efflux carrier, partial [Conidiobolus coronatus NRRL 28638]